jgi:hypothetical protein
MGSEERWNSGKEKQRVNGATMCHNNGDNNNIKQHQATTSSNKQQAFLPPPWSIPIQTT